MTRIINKIGGSFEKSTVLFTKICVIICITCLTMLFFMDNIEMFSGIFVLIVMYILKIVFGFVGACLMILVIYGLSKLFAKPSNEEEEIIQISPLDKVVPTILTENQTEELNVYSASISRYLNTRYAYYNWKYDKINQNVYADLVKYGRTDITILGKQKDCEVKAQATVHMRDALTVLDVIINSGVVCGLESIPDPKSEKEVSKPLPKTTIKEKTKPKKIQTKVKSQKVVQKAQPKTKAKSQKVIQKAQPTTKVKPQKVAQKPQFTQPKSEPTAPTSNILQNNNVIIINGVPQIRPNYEMAAKDWISANMRYINEACEASLLANDYEGEKVVALLKKEKLPKETETWQFIGKLLKDDYNEIDRFSVLEAGITIEID